MTLTKTKRDLKLGKRPPHPPWSVLRVRPPKAHDNSQWNDYWHWLLHQIFSQNRIPSQTLCPLRCFCSFWNWFLLKNTKIDPLSLCLNKNRVLKAKATFRSTYDKLHSNVFVPSLVDNTPELSLGARILSKRQKPDLETKTVLQR